MLLSCVIYWYMGLGELVSIHFMFIAIRHRRCAGSRQREYFPLVEVHAVRRVMTRVSDQV